MYYYDRSKTIADHAALEFSCSDSVSLDVDDIVHLPCDLVVTILIPHGPVPAEVEPRVRTVVGIEELLMVTVDGPGHSWPWPPHTQVTTDVGSGHFLTLKFDLKWQGLLEVRYCIVENFEGSNFHGFRR